MLFSMQKIVYFSKWTHNQIKHTTEHKSDKKKLNFLEQ